MSRWFVCLLGVSSVIEDDPPENLLALSLAFGVRWPPLKLLDESCFYVLTVVAVTSELQLFVLRVVKFSGLAIMLQELQLLLESVDGVTASVGHSCIWEDATVTEVEMWEMTPVVNFLSGSLAEAFYCAHGGDSVKLEVTLFMASRLVDF